MPQDGPRRIDPVLLAQERGRIMAELMGMPAVALHPLAKLCPSFAQAGLPLLGCFPATVAPLPPDLSTGQSLRGRERLIAGAGDGTPVTFDVVAIAGTPGG